MFTGLIFGQTSISVSLSLLWGMAVWLTIETIATDRFTRIAYTKAKPVKPINPKMCLDFIHDTVSVIFPGGCWTTT